ncbi:MAG: hypothetical protein HKL95_01050, partial [Phycisphaerae bacterium]|nr:hypothetical protein [Phycisphaerae bacterium]
MTDSAPLGTPISPFIKPPSMAGRPNVTGSDLQAVEELARAYRNMCEQLGKVIVGQHEVIEQVVTAMFCQGHV